ncbi:outer membrane protein [Rhodanobacter sp. TND4EL1]
MVGKGSSIACRGGLVATLLLAAVAPVAAQERAQDTETHWGIGMAAAVNGLPYRNYKTDVIPLPALSYEGKRIYLRAATVGFRVLGSRTSGLSLTLAPLGMRFRARDSDDARLRRLDDRDLSALAGVAWRYTQDWGVVQASFQKEITGHGGGTISEASYAFPLYKSDLILTPRVGITRTSGALNNYYFGVNAVDSLRSGLARYDARGGNTPWLEMTAVQRLGRHWVVAGGMRYSRLSDEVSNSPMTDKSSAKSFFVSTTYFL